MKQANGQIDKSHYSTSRSTLSFTVQVQIPGRCPTTNSDGGPMRRLDGGEASTTKETSNRDTSSPRRYGDQTSPGRRNVNDDLQFIQCRSSSHDTKTKGTENNIHITVAL